MKRVSDERAAERMVEAYRALCRLAPPFDVTGRIVVRLGEASSRRGRPWTRPWPTLGFAAMGLAMAVSAIVVLRPNAEPRTDRPPVASRPDAAAMQVPAPPPPYAVVLGPEPMLVWREGFAATLLAGDALPFGVPLRPRVGREAAFRIDGAAEFRMSDGTEITLEAQVHAVHGVALHRGRVGVEVPAGPSRLRVRLPSERVEVWASGEAPASFGVLSAQPSVWSVAALAGHVDVIASGERTEVRQGTMVGAAGASGLRTRPIPSTLELSARMRPMLGVTVLSGLTDLLARVTVDGAAVTVDATGRFEHRLAGARAAQVSAIDAAGRLVRREVGLPRAEKALRRPEARPTRTGDGDWLRVQPLDW